MIVILFILSSKKLNLFKILKDLVENNGINLYFG
jgi:hypothetical protein